MKFKLDPVAEQVLNKRYIHFELGEDSWSDVVERVLNHVLPQDEERFRELLLERYFVPSSPTLVNSSTKIAGLAACFVLGMGDSLEEIYETKYRFAKICQKGGGCGVSLSDIRPEGMAVAGSTHSHSAGPVKFLETICKDMDILSQGGFRDMSIMAVMSCSHPDVEKFIQAKTAEGIMSNTNISVMVTDEFMRAAIDGREWSTQFRAPGQPVYEREYNAGDLLRLIAERAWSNGEPKEIWAIS